MKDTSGKSEEISTPKTATRGGLDPDGIGPEGKIPDAMRALLERTRGKKARKTAA